MSVCDISFEHDHDGADFYHEEARKARTNHRCSECRDMILPGSRYVKVAGKSDGSVWSLAICAACRDIIREFTDGSWVFGGAIWDDFMDAWRDGQPLQPCLNRVSSVSAKQKLRGMWLRYKGIQP